MRVLALALALPLVGAVPHGRHHDLKRWTPQPIGVADNIPAPESKTEVTESTDEYGNKVTTTTTRTTSYRPLSPADAEVEAASPAQVEQPQPAPMEIPEDEYAPLRSPKPSSTPIPPARPQSEDQGAEPTAPAAQPSTGNAWNDKSTREEWVQEMLKQLSGQKINEKSVNGLYISIVNQLRVHYKDKRGELKLSTDATVLAERQAGKPKYEHGETKLPNGNEVGQNIAYYPAAKMPGADPELAATLNCIHGWFFEEERLWNYADKQMRADAAQVWAAAGYSGAATVDHFKNVLDARYGSAGFAVQRHSNLNIGQGSVDAYFCVANFELGANAIGGDENLPAKKPDGSFPSPSQLVETFRKEQGKQGAN